MITTAMRLIDLLQLVPKRGQARTAAELRKSLGDRGWEVHVRTVQRDLQELSAVYPLISSGNPMRWRWTDSANAVQAPGLDVTGATIWMMVQLHLQPLMPPGLLKELQPHFSAAAEVLRSSKRGRGSWPGQIASASSNYALLPPPIDANIYERVTEALTRGLCIEVSYVARYEAKSKKLEVNPLGLILRDGTLYLLGMLWEYEDVVHLAIHRIKSVEVLGRSSRRLPGFDLQEYAKGPAFGHLLGKPLKVSLRFAEAAGFHLTESRLAADQVIEKQDSGDFLVTATVQNTLQLRWWILGFGAQLEVLRPAGLRREIAVEAAAMLKRYRK